MANCPDNCPQLDEPTWCAVRDDPGCKNAPDPCILVKQYIQSAAGTKSGAVMSLEEPAAREYLARLEEWIDTAPPAKGGPLDTRKMPMPEKPLR